MLFPWWPFLHRNPVQSASEAVAGVSRFEWEFPVLFFGEYIPAVELPWSYLPVWILFTTPPALLLAGVAALCVLRSELSDAVRERRERTLLAYGVVALAVAFPLLYIVLMQATLYNGLRHVLFCLLPTIVLVAVGWSRALDRLRLAGRIPLFRLFAFGLPLLYLPTLISVVKLHPYQYIYFNSLAGGVRGADNVFDLEYWGTSYKELMEYFCRWLEAEGISGEVVVNMEHPTWLAEPFLPGADSPFRIRLVRSQGEAADFYIANTVWSSHTWWAGEPVVVVERMDVPLAVVKDRRQ